MYEEGRCVAGIEFSSKAVLRVGVALLGARITAHQILELGAMPIATVVVAIVSTIALGAFVARGLGLGRSFGVLSGGAVGICGASAALAIASVLPRTPESERDTILTVVTVTLLSTIAMIIYPLFVTALGFDHVHAGIFLGGTIHDVAQVVALAIRFRPRRATSPLTSSFCGSACCCRWFSPSPSWSVAERRAAWRREGHLPLFLIGFAVLVALNSAGLLSKIDDRSRQ